jgi:hypothetical protein
VKSVVHLPVGFPPQIAEISAVEAGGMPGLQNAGFIRRQPAVQVPRVQAPRHRRPAGRPLRALMSAGVAVVRQKQLRPREGWPFQLCGAFDLNELLS